MILSEKDMPPVSILGQIFFFQGSLPDAIIVYSCLFFIRKNRTSVDQGDGSPVYSLSTPHFANLFPDSIPEMLQYAIDKVCDFIYRDNY